MERRHFLGHGLTASAIVSGAGLLPAVLRAQTAPAAITRDSARALLTSGVQSGDVTANSAIIWARASREATHALALSLESQPRLAEQLRRHGPH